MKLIVWQGLKTALPRVAEDTDVAVLIDRGNERIGCEADSAGVRVALALEESGGDTLRPDAAAAVLRRELLALRGGFGNAFVASARQDAGILILGGGSDIGGLRQAFSCRGGNEHYRGFAVGRSIWREPILVLCNRETTQTEAEATIGDNFLAVVDAFESADRARVGQC